jgi:HSP20 family protein
MTYVKFNKVPFERSFNSFVDDIFTELPGLFRNDAAVTAKRTTVPVNIKETEKAYWLELIAPGFEKSDFKINLDGAVLKLEAEKKKAEDNTDEKQIRSEYSFDSFKRSFTIDDKVDATNIEANYVNGILILKLPKKEIINTSAKEIVIN